MLKKIKKAAANKKKALLQIGVLGAYCILVPQIGFASGFKSSEPLPGMSVLENIIYWVSGPVPAAVATIAIGTSGALAAVGDLGPVAKRALQIVCGASIASQAPNLISIFGIDVTGIFF